MSINIEEAKQVAARISPVYDEHLAKYSFTTYPAADYVRFKTSYSQCSIPNTEIRNSLVWKWRHVGKSNFPSKQKALIEKIEALWPEFVASEDRGSSASTFKWWKAKLPSGPYITVAYITHLVHHAEPLPMIDQHNFRAMNHFLGQLRPAHTSTKEPTSWTDILDFKSFMVTVLKHLPGKSFDELDRFLMMYGKSIKPRKPRKPKKS